MDQLKEIRDRIRRGCYDLSDVEKLEALPCEPESFEYYSKLSLATEILEECGDYRRAASAIGTPGEDIMVSLEDRPIKHTNLAALDDYKLMRQKLWCALAYCLSLYHQEKSKTAVEYLTTIESQLNGAINQPGWPIDRKFRGTLARVHYYLGLTLRGSFDTASLAKKSFSKAAESCGDRLQAQATQEPGRLVTEQRYAMDCAAKLLTFGQAWIQIASGELSEASASLAVAEIFTRSSGNVHLKDTVQLLQLQIKRHQQRYGEEFKTTIQKLRTLVADMKPHSSIWSRTQFELGMHLVHLLRADNLDENYREEESKKLWDVVDAIERTSTLEAGMVNQVERRFQTYWLKAMYWDLQSQPAKALNSLREIEVILTPKSTSVDSESAKSETVGISSSQGLAPLQYWQGQAPLLTARLMIRDGRPEDAIAVLKDSHALQRGPAWMQLLALLRLAKAQADLGQLDEADGTLQCARTISPRVQLQWVLQEQEETIRFLSERRALQIANLANNIPANKRLKILIQDAIDREYNRQQLAYKGRPKFRPGAWYAAVACQNLGLDRETELDDWLKIAGRTIEKLKGRPVRGKSETYFTAQV